MAPRGIDRVGGLAVLAAWIVAAPALAQYREYYIRGKVVDAQKQGIADLEIQLRDVATSSVIHFKTGKDGAFKFAGLPHGVYEATLTKEGYPTTKVEWKFESPQDTMQRVEIPEIVLASQEQVRRVEQAKDTDSGIKGAAEKVKKGDFDGAIPELKALLEKKPKDANAWYFLGLGYVGKKMYSEAAQALTEVTNLTPDFPGAHFELGVCYRELHDSPKALAAFQKSIEIDPGNADGAYNAGLILFEENRIDEALSLFEKGLASKPKDPDLLEMAGRCYIHQAKVPQAVDFLERARAATTDAAKGQFLDTLIAQLKAGAK
jgi:tetratricopeptide (TPR) repeat protein